MGGTAAKADGHVLLYMLATLLIWELAWMGFVAIDGLGLSLTVEQANSLLAMLVLPPCCIATMIQAYRLQRVSRDWLTSGVLAVILLVIQFPGTMGLCAVVNLLLWRTTDNEFFRWMWDCTGWILRP